MAGRTPWLGHRAARSRAFWWTVAHLALDPVVSLLGLLGLGLAVVALVLSPRGPAAARVLAATTALERDRTARLLAYAVPAPDDGAAGRQAAYLAVLPLLATFSTLVLTVAFSVPLTLLTLPVSLWALPNGAAHLGPVVVDSEGGALLVALVAVVVVLLAGPGLVRAAAALDRGAVGTFLGARTVPDPELSRRVEDLVVSRARVVDSVEAERRRIERDLHDGAQQRLVALALTLGRAEARLDPDAGGAPDPAVLARLLHQAHREADAAISELRDLTRGLSPPMLAERGLGAALAELAARAPLPVELDLDEAPDRDRLGSAVEAVLYFVAAEALTNVVKHADATRVTITLRRPHGATARLVFTDDGRGGASADDPTGGLTGLADRLSGVDGTLRLQSPAGGPTTLTAEV